MPFGFTSKGKHITRFTASALQKRRIMSNNYKISRTTTSGEPFCMSGSEHAVKAEYFESPFKTSEATYDETMGLAT